MPTLRQADVWLQRAAESANIPERLGRRHSGSSRISSSVRKNHARAGLRYVELPGRKTHHLRCSGAGFFAGFSGSHIFQAWVRGIVTILGTVGGLGAVTWTFVRSGIELPLLGAVTRRKRRGP
jgi:hypothetical protein